MKKVVLMIVCLTLAAFSARAQQWAIGTNLLDYVNFGTLNVEGSVAVSRHIVLDAGLKYNPWMFGNTSVPELTKYNKQRTVYISGRYYPWFSYDGWYIGATVGYMEYSEGGILSKLAEDGDAFGGGLGAGYTLLLHKNLNLNFGGYVWCGGRTYTEYQCPVCGRVSDQGSKFFVMPFNLNVSLTWVFNTPQNKGVRTPKNKKKTEIVRYEEDF